jgi:hypothetical protein
LFTSFNVINFRENALNTGFYNIPPDPIGVAGPDHVVAVVNTSIEWLTKRGLELNSQSLASFFSALSPTTGTFDPKVIYDQYEDRFVVITLELDDNGFNNPANISKIFIAVSDDENPEGTWHFQEIDTKLFLNITILRDFWADYPGLAIDEEAIYITANMFGFQFRDFGGSRLWIIDKNPLYNGGTSTVNLYDPSSLTGLPGDAFTIQPAHTFGTVAAGVGTFLVNTGWVSGPTDFLSIIRVNNPLSSPTFTNQFVSLGDITSGSSLSDAPQPDTSITIETNDGRALHAVWRNDFLWTASTVNPVSGPDAGQATAHWYQINTTNLDALSLQDQGNIGGEDIASGTYTFFPCIAVDQNNNAAIGFAASGPTVYAGAYYTGRLASEPAGTVQPSSVLRAGLDYYIRTFGSGRNRWGDYSGMSVDPVDDETFWVFNEYAIERGNPTSGNEDGQWGTAFGSFRLEPQLVQAGDIVITEIMFDPLTVSDANGEWVEIFNASGSSIDLNGWVIRDNGSDFHQITNGGPLLILPQGLFVLGINSDPLFNGNYTTDYEYDNFTLDNGADEVIIEDFSATAIDQVNYDASAGFPSPSGASIALRNFQADNNAGVNWTASSAREPSYIGITGDLGSPGILGLDQSLPVLLSSFSATAESDKVVLRWTTESEINNLGFKILKFNRQYGEYQEFASFDRDSALVGQHNSTQSHQYEHFDHQVVPGNIYWYQLMDVDIYGTQTVHGPISVSVVGSEDVTSQQFKLYGNYPNPFNSATRINFRLPEASRVKISVFNALGESVAVLANEYFPVGLNSVFWNPINLASGIYICRIETAKIFVTKKMVLLK